MKLIPLTLGNFAQVDDEFYDYLNQFKWHTHKDRKRCYARTTIKIDGAPKKVLMHRIVLKPKINEVCDHKDGNGLNNTKENLRICTRSQNSKNQKPKNGGSSLYKGVYFNKDTGKWLARITTNRNCKYLGLFGNEIDAAKEYNNEALKMHGEFAKINDL